MSATLAAAYPVSDLIDRFVSINDGARLLNLGFGVGMETVFMAGRGYVIEAVDMEPAPSGLIHFLAEEKLPVNFHCQRMEDFLPTVPAHTFDVLVAIYVLYYPDLAGEFLFKSQMAEMMRVLKPGGLFVAKLMHYRSGVNMPVVTDLSKLTTEWLEAIWRPHMQEVHYEPERPFEPEEGDEMCAWELVGKKM